MAEWAKSLRCAEQNCCHTHSPFAHLYPRAHATQWADSPLVRAARYGALCVLDGFERLPMDAACVLLPLLQDRMLQLQTNGLAIDRGVGRGRGRGEQCCCTRIGRSVSPAYSISHRQPNFP